MKRTLLVAILVICAMGTPRPAMANHTIATAWEGVLGEGRRFVIGAVGTNDTINLLYRLVKDRSYIAFVWAPLTDGGGGGCCSVSFRNLVGTSVGSQVFAEPEVNGQSAFIPTTTSAFIVRLFNASASANTIHVMVVETTLSSPWYFRNNGTGYEGYITLRNNTSGPLDVVVTVYNASGFVVGTTVLNTTMANGNVVIPIGSTYGIATGQGSAQIAHKGMPGAVTANLTTVSATTGLSFDAPFTPRMVWSTTFGAQE